jgi:hypothetical protein
MRISNLKSKAKWAQYDPSLQVLRLRVFDEMYDYHGVTPDMYDSFCESESKWDYVTHQLSASCPMSRVEEHTDASGGTERHRFESLAGQLIHLVEFVVKSIAVWVAINLAFRIPIFAHLVADTDALTLLVMASALVLSVILTGFAVFGQSLLARYAVLAIVCVFFWVVAAFVCLFPIYYAWNLHGFWGAAGAFFLPGLSWTWVTWVQIREGYSGYPIVWGIAVIYGLLRIWCKSAVEVHLRYVTQRPRVKFSNQDFTKVKSVN